MISADLLSPTTINAGWVIYIAAIGWAALRVPWVELFTDSRRQHLLFGTVVALFILWMVRRDFPSGLSFHFIGMTAVTLLLAWPQAIFAAALAQAGLVALGFQEVAAIGPNGVLLVVIPVLVTEVCAQLVERSQPKNLFVYIFFAGFFPAALATLCVILVSLGILIGDGRFPMPPWIQDFAGYLWLIIFPEAFINGTAVTALVVFYPDWLETFNRTRYLSAPWKDERPRPDQ